MTPKEKADGIMAQHLDRFNTALADAYKLGDSPRNLDYRGKRMVKIADELAGLVSPVSPCRKGCGHCCHQATMLSSWEAEQIAEFTKRPIKNIKGYEPDKGKREQLIEQFSGVPCPFLSNNICSIYPVRPFSCRLYFSMADDSGSCDIINDPGGIVPWFNFRPLEMAIANLFFVREKCQYGDIREFFPRKD